MTQTQIDRLVSQATGESLREIHHRGFGLRIRWTLILIRSPATCVLKLSTGTCSIASV